MLERFPNDKFFGAARRGRTLPESVPAVEFFPGVRAPPQEPLAYRLARTPFRFGMALFLVGWAGIVFQASFFQQVVFGAPVFEEMAKLGPPLLVVTLLGTRSRWSALPYALLAGAAFGVFEHYLTYAAESWPLFMGRILFHAATTGLSMVVYMLVMDVPDVRARWVTTVPSTLLHWANNFAALVLAVVSVFEPTAEAIAIGWSSLVTLAVVLALGLALLAPHVSRRVLLRVLAETVPRLELERQPDGILAPPGHTPS